MSKIEEEDKKLSQWEEFRLMLRESSTWATGFIESLNPLGDEKELEFMKPGESLYIPPWLIECDISRKKIFVKNRTKGVFNRRGSSTCEIRLELDGKFTILIDEKDKGRIVYNINYVSNFKKDLIVSNISVVNNYSNVRDFFE